MINEFVVNIWRSGYIIYVATWMADEVTSSIQIYEDNAHDERDSKMPLFRPKANVDFFIATLFLMEYVVT